jgi:hypothetical protein
MRAPHQLVGGAARFIDRGPSNASVVAFPGVLRVECRLDPLITGSAETWNLRPPADVARGADAARRELERLAGVPMDGGRDYYADAELARFDLTHDLHFDDPADGLAFLHTKHQEPTNSAPVETGPTHQSDPSGYHP